MGGGGKYYVPEGENLMTSNNPFHERGMIHDPRRFFGRAGEMQAIIERLETLDNLSVVGAPQVGKSSLLLYLVNRGWEQQDPPYRPANAAAWSQALADYELYFVDMSLIRSAGDFYRHILEELGAEGSTARQLRKVASGRKVVLCLDEFGRTANNPNFPPDYFEALRGLAQTGELAFITATRATLVDLVLSGAIGASPFYNVFVQLPLKPLDDEESRQLLAGTAALAGVSFDEKALKFAVKLAGGHPSRLQVVGRLLIESQQEGDLNLQQVQHRFTQLFGETPVEAPPKRAASPNRSLLFVAGWFLAVAGLMAVMASLWENLALGLVSIALIVAAAVLGGMSFIHTPAGKGS